MKTDKKQSKIAVKDLKVRKSVSGGTSGHGTSSTGHGTSSTGHGTNSIKNPTGGSTIASVVV